MTFLEALLAWLLIVYSLIGVQSEPEPPPVMGTAEIEALICARDWPCSEALAIAHCESRLQPMATGSAGERGIFQIHPIHGGGDELYDPQTNIDAAYRLWVISGWGPWSCSAGAY